jgi:hypothetical protein
MDPHLNFYLETDYWELVKEVSFFTTNSFSGVAKTSI